MASSHSQGSPSPTYPSHKARILTLTEIRNASWSRIYAEGLGTGNVGLSTQLVPSWKEFDNVMLKSHRYIATDPLYNAALGWITVFEPFPLLPLGFSHTDKLGSQVLELWVFVATGARSCGIGCLLVETLLQSIKKDSLRTWSIVQASCFPENQSALALLTKFGFQRVTMRKKVGRMVDGPDRGKPRDLIVFELAINQGQQQQHHDDTDVLVSEMTEQTGPRDYVPHHSSVHLYNGPTGSVPHHLSVHLYNGPTGSVSTYLKDGAGVSVSPDLQHRFESGKDPSNTQEHLDRNPCTIDPQQLSIKRQRKE